MRWLSLALARGTYAALQKKRTTLACILKWNLRQETTSGISPWRGCHREFVLNRHPRANPLFNTDNRKEKWDQPYMRPSRFLLPRISHQIVRHGQCPITAIRFCQVGGISPSRRFGRPRCPGRTRRPRAPSISSLNRSRPKAFPHLIDSRMHSTVSLAIS